MSPREVPAHSDNLQMQHLCRYYDLFPAISTITELIERVETYVFPYNEDELNTLQNVRDSIVSTYNILDTISCVGWPQTIGTTYIEIYTLYGNIIETMQID